MKYSLRSLMIVVTLACVAAAYAGNVAYYQKQAAFHEREVDALMVRLCPTGPSVYTSSEEIRRDLKLRNYHGRLMDAYRNAAWKPWVVIREAPAP